MSARKPRRPPGVARWCVRMMVPAPNRDFVLDDLEEEWLRRVAADGRRAAARWYWRQVLQSVGPALSLRSGARAAVSPMAPRSRLRFELHAAVSELRGAARRLRRSPGFTVAAGSTLAIGIAANVAIFSLVHAVLLRALPFPESDHLVSLRHVAPAFGPGETGVSEGVFVHYRENNRVFSDIAIWQTASVNLTAEAEPERVDLVLATPSLFPLLGVRPLVGRGFGPDAVGGKAVLLSYGLWQRRYGGDASLIGRTIEVNGVARMVAGVMPADFRFPHPRIDLWMDLGVRGGAGTLDSFHYQGLARLHDGVTVERATADLRRLIATLDVPGAGVAGVRESLMPIVQPLRDYVVRDVRSMLWLLFGAMAFVLLIVSANVANLHLVRASAREREVVVRAALGAGRGQLMRPFIAESVLLAALGGGLGLLVGWAAVRALAAMAVVNVPRLDEVSVDARVIAFGIVLSLGTGVVLGLVPAARVVRTGLAGGLRSAGRAFTASRERRRTQHALVIVQVAIALTLLIGSALMVQTLWRLRTTDPGFDTRDLLTFEVILPYGGYETYEKSARLQLALLDRVRALPDVVSAGAVSGLPMAASEFPELPVEVRVFGEADAGAGDRQVRYRLVADGYFETMRIAIVEGRVPERTYHGAGGAPALINSSLAKKLFPNQTALGKRVRRLRPERSTEEERWNTIVGVVADVKHDGLAEPAPGMVYLPILDTTAEPGNSPGFLTFALRMNGPTLALVPAIRRIVQELDPALPIANVRSMQDIVDAATARTTFTTLLLGVATVAALFLGVIGIYGVLSYAVGLRRREMGLRMALGARAQEVVRLVLRDGLRLTVLGLLLGTIAAASLTRIMHGMLYGVSPTDPATFASTATVLFTVALFACVLPALRAARVQPVEALADE